MKRVVLWGLIAICLTGLGGYYLTKTAHDKRARDILSGQLAAARIAEILSSADQIHQAALDGHQISASEIAAISGLPAVLQDDLGTLSGTYYILSQALVDSVNLDEMPGSGHYRGQFLMQAPTGLVYYLALPATAARQLSAFLEQPAVLDEKPLANPFIGWAPWSFQLPDLQGEYALAYAGIYWRDLEPQEGLYDFSAIEAENQFKYCRDHNIRLILRLIADYPNDARSMQLPDWLYAKIGGDGIWYKRPDGSGGFSPNYENPLLIEAHRALLNALGERYNSDPLIAFIQFGSLGHYGEWHVSSIAGKMPSEPVIDQYVSHYQKAFPDKVFLFRRPVAQLKMVRAGLYNDMFGVKESTDTWLGWISGQSDAEFPAMIAAPDFWTEGPSGGEFAYGDSGRFLNADTITETRRQVAASHTSFLGPSAPVHLTTQTQKDNAAELLKIMGYRFRIQSVQYPRLAISGNQLRIRLNMMNIGNSPLYYRWPVSLQMKDDDGRVTAVWNFETDIRTWLPGSIAVDGAFELPDRLVPGRYNLSLAILDPVTGLPGIILANAGKNPDGYYSLCTIYIR